MTDVGLHVQFQCGASLLRDLHPIGEHLEGLNAEQGQ